MPPIYRKEPKTKASSYRAMRAAILTAALAVCAASVNAQSSSSSFGSISYSFGLDANSSNLGQFLTVNDAGEKTYNLIDYGSYPYGTATGSGVFNTNVSPDTNYNGADWTGYNGISSNAFESGITGSAFASVGSQENLQFTNTGSNAISIDVWATALVLGSAASTGISSNWNYANVDTYAGIYDFNLTTFVAEGNPYIHLSGNDSSGVGTFATSDWSTSLFNGLTYYNGYYVMTIIPGEEHALEFYASGKNAAVANAVPTPSSASGLTVGLLTLGLLRRRRNKAR